MKVKIILTCCISFMCLFMLMSVLPVNGEEKIYDNMIRLHVLANSDSEEDQALKLEVRDAVLSAAAGIKADNADDAYIRTEASMDALRQAAEKIVTERGYDYNVRVTLTEERYPEREYDGFVLPEGKYTSLRVLIGEAEGKNWWCVLYPPLCTASAESREDVFIAAGFTEGQYKTITESEGKRYKIKFKIVEILKELFE